MANVRLFVSQQILFADNGFLSYQEFTDGLYPEVPKVAFHFYDALDGIEDVKIGRGVADAILAYLDKDREYDKRQTVNNTRAYFQKYFFL